LHLVQFVYFFYFTIINVVLIRKRSIIDKTENADFKSEVKFLSAGQDIER